MNPNYASLNLFFSYAREDEPLRNEMEKHLQLLVRQGVITTWSDRDITAGSEWAGQISQAIESAQIILLLISADFLASDYCYDVEMAKALERHDRGETWVIPVILREVDWHGAPFAKLKASPQNAKPVMKWGDRDQAFADIAREIRSVAERLRNPERAAKLPHKIDRLAEESFAENLPRSGATEFVGRDEILAEIHQTLQHDSPNQDLAIVGMGGIGKTELALQYALRHRHAYSGGICWLRATEDIGLQIVQFGRSRLKLNPTEQLDLNEQVGFCWKNWPSGDVLLVLDNLTQYRRIKPYLPPSNSRFYVLITTRERLGRSIPQSELEVLPADSALHLLQSLITKERLQSELDTAYQLCAWLGYLPLGIELVGRYLERKPELSLVEMQRRLQTKRLEERAITAADADMTAQIGIAAAFDLSWETLSEPAKRLGCLLSLFASAPILWSMVESCMVTTDPEELETLRDDVLLSVHLLQRRNKGIYQLHALIREFFQQKRMGIAEALLLEQQFCNSMAEVAQSIPASPTHPLIIQAGIKIPHIVEATTAYPSSIPDDRLLMPFVGVGRYYEGQGLYQQAQDLYVQGLAASAVRFGENHLATAQALSYLAANLREQGQNDEAEPLVNRALAIRQQLLPSDDPAIADSLDDLAILYINQYNYDEAEPLCLQALAIRCQHLGDEHPLVAESLNNLASIYKGMDRLLEAEALFLQAISIRKKHLADDHPDIIITLNNLADCYQSQGKYDAAEPIFVEALQRAEVYFGDKHPNIALALNNLAALYYDQQRYVEAESLWLRSLDMNRHFWGEEHSDVALNLSNLASCYDSLGRSLEAEAFYWQALTMRENLFGLSHPEVAKTLNNLAKSHFLQRRYDEAEPLYERAIAIFSTVFGDEHPYPIKVRSNLQELRNARN